MIISTFEDYKKTCLPKKIRDIIDELYLFRNEDLTIGQFPLSHNAVAYVSEYETKQEKDVLFETHDEMTDIQFLIKGEEYIKARTSKDLTLSEKEHDREDLTFYKEQPDDFTKIFLSSDVFCIFFPKEAHAPSICVNSPSKVLKVVVKVPLTEKEITN